MIIFAKIIAIVSIIWVKTSKTSKNKIDGILITLNRVPAENV